MYILLLTLNTKIFNRFTSFAV